MVELTPWELLPYIISITSLLIVLYADVIRPWLKAKPDIIYVATPHFVPPDTAINAFLIQNRGKGPARDVGIYLEFKRPYNIKEVKSSLAHNITEGGKDDWRVKIVWDRLDPKNSIDVAIFSEADPADVRSIVPEMFRLWHEGGIIAEQSW